MSLCNPGWPAFYVDEAGLEFTRHPLHTLLNAGIAFMSHHAQLKVQIIRRISEEAAKFGP